jgi:hypothetical protein
VPQVYQKEDTDEEAKEKIKNKRWKLLMRLAR